jgi:hypothetical protein
MDDDDGPPMLVSGENVGDADESNLNAEMADAQIKKVPISIITGELVIHLLVVSLLLRCTLAPLLLALQVENARLASNRAVSSATA